MSGHSRWAGIKHKKAIIDAKRGKVFTRIIREVTIAARQGGGKIESNPRLRSAVEIAKAANMPQENIKKAIQKGTGELPGVTIEETTYEGYGPAGVAVIIEATTDNKNRTTAEIRHLFADSGGNMGESNSVAWMFDNKGVITIPKESIAEEKITDMVIELGAEDIKSDNSDIYEVTTAPADFLSIKAKLEQAAVKINSAELTMIPKNTIKLEGEAAEKCLKFMEVLDEHEDVKTVHANFDISDEDMQKLSGGA